jgi:hypothetical protein
MSTARVRDVPIGGVTPVYVLEGLGENFGSRRDRYHMYVVRHQAVSQHRERLLAQRLPQQIEIDQALRLRGQNELPPVAALRYMMRNIGHHHPSPSRHPPHPSAVTESATQSSGLALSTAE